MNCKLNNSNTGTLKDCTEKNLRALHVLEDLEPFLKIFYT